MTLRKKYLLTPKLSLAYQPAWLPSLAQKILSNSYEVRTEKTLKVAHLTMDYWLTKIFNLLAKVSARFYLHSAIQSVRIAKLYVQKLARFSDIHCTVY